MRPRPPRTTRTYTRLPAPPLFRSPPLPPAGGSPWAAADPPSLAAAAPPPFFTTDRKDNNDGKDSGALLFELWAYRGDGRRRRRGRARRGRRGDRKSTRLNSSH